MRDRGGRGFVCRELFPLPSVRAPPTHAHTHEFAEGDDNEDSFKAKSSLAFRPHARIASEIRRVGWLLTRVAVRLRGSVTSRTHTRASKGEAGCDQKEREREKRFPEYTAGHGLYSAHEGKAKLVSPYFSLLLS